MNFVQRFFERFMFRSRCSREGNKNVERSRDQNFVKGRLPSNPDIVYVFRKFFGVLVFRSQNQSMGLNRAGTNKDSSQGVLEISVTVPSLSVLSVASVKPWFRTMVWNFQVSLELKSNGEINLFKIVVSENQQNYEINGELKMIFNNKSF